MRYATSCGALALLIGLLLLMSAARPFERVAAGDTSYDQLAVLSEAGLLQGYALPAGELSRLEAAVLVQRALGSYGDARLAGREADSAVESALTALLGSFGDELGQLGVSTPSAQAVIGANSTIDRLEQIAAEDDAEEAEDDASNTYLASLYPAEDEAAAEAETPGIESSLYGKFYIQGQSFNTDRTDGTSRKEGDVKMYWGETGFDVSHKDWSARFSVLWNDSEEDINVYEAWAKYKNPDNGWFAQFGQVLLPFGNNDYYFPTYPAVNDLGFTTAHGVGTGIEKESWGISAYAYNPKVEIVDEEDQVSDYSFVWNISQREADECHDGWKLRAGYNTSLGAHDIRIAGDGPLADRSAAYNVFGRYDWGGNRFHLLADYTAALDEFDAVDLDADDDNIGDKPSALNTEFVYEPHPDNLYGVSYQATDEMADYAETRYGVMFGKRLDDLAMFKLEYTHGEYGKFVTDKQDSDDRFVAEVYIEF